MALLARAYRATAVVDWTNDVNVLHRDGATASSDTDGAQLTLSGSDFAAIPADATIDGVQITLVAKKDTSSGSGTLWLEAEVNDDSGWTSSGYVSANLTGSEAVYTIGGPGDLWGGTFTRASLEPDVRITTNGSGMSGTPLWVVNYVEVTVWYTITTDLAVGVQETTTAVDAMAPSRKFRGISESVHATTNARGPNNPMAGKSGDAVEIQALPADFNAATTPRTSLVGLGATLSLRKAAGGISTIKIGDDILAPEFGLQFQEGVIAWDSITHTGAAGVEAEYSDASVVLRNQSYTDTAGTTKTIADWCRVAYMIGSTVWIYAAARGPAGTWYQRCIFEGAIASFLIGEASVELRLTQERRERAQIPILTLGPTLLTYGTDEGTLPRDQAGTPIPLAFGRFDPSAIKAWPTTSIYNDRNQGAFLGAALGLKFPMVPVPLISDLYRRKAGSVEPTSQRQALFAFGDSSIGVQLTNGPGSNGRAIEQFEFPTQFASETVDQNNASYLFRGAHLFQWDDETDRARPFARDASLSLPAEAYYSGAGVWYWNLTAATDGGRVQPFFVTRLNPLWDGLGFTAKWGGAMQSVFLSPRSFSQYPYSTQGVNWITTTNVVNPANALTTDLSTFADMPPGTSILGVQFSGKASLPGEIIAIRLWVVSEKSGVDDTLAESMEVRFRNSWRTWTQLKADFNTSAVTTPGSERGVISKSKSRFIHSFYVYERDSSAIPRTGDLVGGDYPFNTFSGELVAWNWEVGIRNRSSFNHLHVAHVALEVICASDYRAGADTAIARTARPVLAPHRRTGGPFAPPSSSPSAPGRLRTGSAHAWSGQVQNVPDPIKILGSTTIYATGRSVVDTTGTPTFTETAGSVIETPPDIARFVAATYLGDFTYTAVGSAFGSLVTARTILNAKIGGGDRWRLSPIIAETTDVQQFFDEMAAQSMSFCRRQVSATQAESYEWRWFVDGPAPHTDDPARLYRTDGFYFGPDTIARDSIAISSTDAGDLYSKFVLRYGYHEPSGKFAYSMQVDKLSDNLLTNGSAYRLACANVETGFDIQRPLTIDAPWVWSEAVADRLLKWHVDLRRQRRQMIEFVTGPNGLDVQEGHVIRFADDLALWHKYPGLSGSASWSAHQFVVTAVTVECEPLQPIRVRITALETYEAAA